MTLPIDWKFNPDHTELDESGTIGTGEETLVDWACTVAITEPGGLPDNRSFGAGFNERIRNGVQETSSLAAVLRSHLLEDDRVAEVDLTAKTQAGELILPIGITSSEGPYNLSGPLTAELVEKIIRDMGLVE